MLLWWDAAGWEDCSALQTAVAVTGVIFTVGSQEGGLRDQILLARRLSEHEGSLSEL